MGSIYIYYTCFCLTIQDTDQVLQRLIRLFPYFMQEFLVIMLYILLQLLILEGESNDRQGTT